MNLERNLEQSVEQPTKQNNSLLLSFASTNDIIEPFFGNAKRRDLQLRQFVLTEPYLSSAIFSISATRAALSYVLDGTPRSVQATQDLLQSAEFGKGWATFLQMVLYDLLTTDSGAFIEIIRDKPRAGRSPHTAPVIGINHLDSLRCILTGNPLQPVIYNDEDNKLHKLQWYDVIHLTEQPHPAREANGRQISFVSRVLKASQLLRDIEQYEGERVGGRFAKEIHLVSGVAQREIENLQKKGQIDADNKGLTRFMPSLILASLDPNASVDHVQIPLASLPENFNKDETLKNYITLLAMAAGVDQQELAPLSTGNLGTSAQSSTLHQKSKVKGIQLFIKLLEQAFQNKGVIPKNVQFTFLQKDIQEELDLAKAAQTRADTRATRIESGEITIDIARQIAADDGDLKQAYLIELGEQDRTPTVEVMDGENVATELVNKDSKLQVKMSAKVANWWRNLIEEHPVQSVSPIKDYQLDNFETALRNEITQEMVFGTNVGWQSKYLIRAAKEAGIHAHTLRHRLPDEYFTLVTNDFIKDNRGNLIYSNIQEKDYNIARIAPPQNLEHAGYVFIPFKGWKSVKNTKDGFVGKDSRLQYDLDETLTAFDKQFTEASSQNKKLGLFLSTANYLMMLGKNRDYITEKEVDTLKELTNKAATLIDASNNPDTLKFLLLSAYL